MQLQEALQAFPGLFDYTRVMERSRWIFLCGSLAMATPAQERVLTVGDVEGRSVLAREDDQYRSVLAVASEAMGRLSLVPLVLVRVHDGAVSFRRIDLKLVVRTGENLRVQQGEILYVGRRGFFGGSTIPEEDVLAVVLAAKLEVPVRTAIWKYAARSIAKAKSAKLSVPWRLLFLRLHDDVNVRVRHVHELGGLGAEAAAAVPDLVDALEVGGRLTSETIQTLGRIGPTAFQARPNLQALVANEKLGTLAKAALQAIGDKPPASLGLTGAALRRAQAMDQLNMRWHYQTLIQYRSRFKTLPRGGGTRFLADPWVRGVVERNGQNLARYFSSARQATDPEFKRLQRAGADASWLTRASVRSSPSGFYAVAKAHKRGLLSGKRVVMCSPLYADGTVSVLYGDGRTRLVEIPSKQRANWTPAEWKLTRE